MQILIKQGLLKIGSSLWVVAQNWGNSVTWSKKQSVVSRSIFKVEFRVVVNGVCKLVRLKQLMTDLRIF